MYLYSVAYFTQKSQTYTNIHMKYGVVMVWAGNNQEAIGHGLEWLRKTYPVHEGWFNHSVEALRLDNNVIEIAYSKLQKRKETNGK